MKYLKIPVSDLMESEPNIVDGICSMRKTDVCHEIGMSCEECMETLAKKYIVDEDEEQKEMKVTRGMGEEHVREILSGWLRRAPNCSRIAR
jgi:hypothetical protein